MFIKFRHIPFRWQLYHLFLHAYVHYSIAFYAHAPSIAPLRACEINRISSHHLMDIDAIMHYYGINAGIL